MSVSIIVPVYNEEECIQSSFERIAKALTPIEPDYKHVELIFINDGSRDKTPELLESLKQFNTSSLTVEVLHFSRNFGHSAAVLAGLEAAKGNYVGIIDADMQDPPEMLHEMVNKIKEGHDVAYGLRVSRQGETLFKKITAWGFYRVINVLASVDIPKDTGDFRVMSRQAVDALLTCEDQTPFIRGLVAWIGFNQIAVPYPREERKLGTTKYPLSKMIKFAWQAISSFSQAPLLFIVYLGLIMFLLSMAIGVWAFIQFLNGHVIPGWTSLLLGFISGNSVTLIMLGIMGLYLGKVIDQVRGRPRYILKKAHKEL